MSTSKLLRKIDLQEGKNNGTQVKKDRNRKKERKAQFGNFSEGIRTNKEKLKVMFRKRNKEKLDKYREKELKVIGKE